MRLNAVLCRYEDVAKDRNTGDYLLQTAGNGDCMHEACIPHRYLAQGNSKGEIRGRSRHQNNRKMGVRNMEET